MKSGFDVKVGNISNDGVTIDKNYVLETKQIKVGIRV